ncbi:MAG: LPS-assembly protein LptD [Minwuia sp.]|uniref:LPS-assembly protein LptD n=1 Tax=Minwuia sp. TaxID=2493630 RepID=UPI003A8A28EC
MPRTPGRPPIWQLKAGKVTRDLNEEIVEYDDAMLELFGIPVFYTPYFYHPDPTVERKSGLLAPTFAHSGELGFQYEQPVYFVIDDQSDLTLSPRLTSREGPVLRGEHRQQFSFGSIESDGSITYVEDEDGNGRKNGDNVVRGHFKSVGNFRLNDNFTSGYDVLYTSDDTYMRVYDIQGGTQTRSRAFVNGFNGRDFAGMEAFYFQDLTDGAKEGDIPIVLPLAELVVGGEPDVIGGRVQAEFTGLALQRTGGRDVRRLSLDTGWERQFVDGIGGVTTIGGYVSADGYNVSEAQATDPTASEDDYFIGRIWPMAVLDWRLPMVRTGERIDQTFEPRIQIIGSPAVGNANDIPNEDSQSFEFSDANLFSKNRFAGEDRIDSGSRVNYGFTTALLGSSGGSTEFAIGQSVRLNDNSQFGVGSGLEDRFSDIVGRLTIAPSSWFNYTFRYRVGLDRPELNRHEHQLRYLGDIFTLDLGYVSVPRDINGVNAGNIEEVNFEGTVNFLDNWSLIGGYRGDLDGGPIRMEGGIRYLDECFDFQFGASRDFTSDRDADATTAFLVRFRLRGLN